MGESRLNKSFATAIRLYHMSRNNSYDECAKEIGVGRTSLIKIEKGQANPTLETVETVADNIGCDPSVLLNLPVIPDINAAVLTMDCLTDTPAQAMETLRQAQEHLMLAYSLLQNVYSSLTAAALAQEKPD